MGWGGLSPSLYLRVAAKLGQAKPLFPLMASTCQPRHLWDLQGDWDRDEDRNGPVLLRVLPAGVSVFRDPQNN